MQSKLLDFIRRVIANDENLTRVELSDENLDDASIAQLMQAFTNNEEAALRIVMLNFSDNQLSGILDFRMFKNITRLYLSNNQLTTPPILTGLVKLNKLYLSANQLREPPNLIGLEALLEVLLSYNQLLKSPVITGNTRLFELALSSNKLRFVPILTGCSSLRKVRLDGNLLTTIPDVTKNTKLIFLDMSANPITDATKVIIREFSRAHNNILTIRLDTPAPDRMQLTVNILNEHFGSMLRVNQDDMIDYIKNIGALCLLSYLPVDLIRIITKPEVERTQVNLACFKSMLQRLTEDDNAQLYALNNYSNTIYKDIVHETEKYYGRVFDSVKDIIRLRNAAKRTNAAALNHIIPSLTAESDAIAPTSSPLVFTSLVANPRFTANKYNNRNNISSRCCSIF